jgi:anti-sigma factor RsiW
MKALGSEISDDDLHAYVDDRLGDAERARVEAHLAAHPEAAARVQSWKSGVESLRAALAWKIAEPVPPHLSLAHLAAVRARRGWRPQRAAAGIAVALLIGAGSGWLAHGPGPSAGVVALGQEAASVHLAYTASAMYPEALSPAHTAELVSWATQRLGRKIVPPDLSASGYGLLGGRMVATTHGAGCMFLYRDAGGNRITVFLRPMQQIDMTAPMRAVGANGAAGFAWARHGLGVSLISSPGVSTLRALSNDVRSQLDTGT